MKRNIIILSLVFFIVFSYVYLSKTKEKNVVLDNKNQGITKKHDDISDYDKKSKWGGGAYINKEYNLSFSYNEGWFLIDNELGYGTVSLYNYDSDGSGFSSGENKIQISVNDEGYKLLVSSDYPETSRLVEDVVVVGQKSKKIDIELIGGEKIRTYYIPIPLKNNYIVLSIYGDYNNFNTLDEIIKSLEWIKY